ncbi:MAG: tetratricopeptide repeat protein [Thermoguttaceae bacterium]
MRTFNLRFAAILLASVVVFGIGVFVLHAVQIKHNAAAFRDQADAAEKQADDYAKQGDGPHEEKARRSAINYLKWYVNLMPKDIDQLERLARMQLKASHLNTPEEIEDPSQVKDPLLFREGRKRLELTVFFDPARKNARRELVRLSLPPYGDRYQDAKDHLTSSLLRDAPKDAELLEQLGICQAGTGSVEAAIETFKKAIAAAPSQLTTYKELASLYRSPRLSKAHEADQWMEKMVAANPKAARAHYLRSDYLLRTGQIEAGAKEALEALQLAPDDREALMLAIMCYAMQGKPDKARELADRAIKLYPTKPETYQTKAKIERSFGKPDSAVSVLRQGLKATRRKPNSPGATSVGEDILLLWTLGDTLLDAKQVSEAETVVDSLRKENIPKEYVRYLAARIHLAKQNWRAARDGFQEILPAVIDPSGSMERQRMGRTLARNMYLWIGQCYGQLGNPARQIQSYEEALNVDPSYVQARASLIDALMAAGRIDEALEQYRKLGSRSRLPAVAVIEYVRLMLLRNLRLQPSERDWATVDKALDNAEKALPGSPDLVLLRAQSLRARDRDAEAEALLSKARERDPKQPAFLQSLIALAEKRSDWAAAEKLIEDSRRLIGDTPDQRLQQGQYLVRRHGNDAASGLRALAENSDKFANADRARLWGGLISLAAQAGDAKLANELRQKLAATQPNNLQVRLSLLERAIFAKDMAGAQKALDEMERVGGQEAYWLYGKAMLCMMRADEEKDPIKQRDLFADALEYVTKAREQRKDWERLPLIAAELYLTQGNLDQALANFREAIDLGERSPGAVTRFLQVLLQARLFTEADKYFRQLEREQGARLPLEVVQMGANASLMLGDVSRALTLARKAIPADCKDASQFVWMSQVLAEASLRAKAEQDNAKAERLLAEAEKTARRAVELKPQSPPTWITLVRLLVALGEEHKAEAACQEAATKLPAKEIALTQAQMYELMNKPDQAAEKYEAALASDPKNVAFLRAAVDFEIRSGKVEAAEGRLETILGGKLASSQDDQTWARQKLSMILITRGRRPDLAKARELMKKNLASGTLSPLDRRLDYMIDLSDPDPAVRGEATRKLEDMRKSQWATPEDRYALVQMYLAAKDWAKASGEFRSLVAIAPQEPRYLIAYISMLLQHGQISDVEMYVDRLEKLLPRQFVPIGFRADVLVARGQPEKALALLNDYVTTSDALPKDATIRGRFVAEKLRQLQIKLPGGEKNPLAGQFARRAEELFREYAAKNPGQDLVLAVFLRAQGKLDDALAIVDKVQDNSAQQDIIRVCAAMWAGGNKLTPAQVGRMDAIVERALAKFDRPAALLSLGAEIRIRQARYADAEALYRESLKKSKSDVVVMNNLAVLLALQNVKLDEALKLMDQAVDTAGRVGAMLDSRASVYIAKKDSKNALKDIRDALADAETPVRLMHLAQALELAGQPKEARVEMDKALKAGLTVEMLQPLEATTFERLRQLPR